MKQPYSLPYGRTDIHIEIDESQHVDLILPKELHPDLTADKIVSTAIRNPLNSHGFLPQLNPESRVVITVNDKTRPVPNHLLFPPLLEALGQIGVCKDNITILIATGTHTPMADNEHCLILPNAILQEYKVISHDCDQQSNLSCKGTTSRGTPVWVNSLFDQADLRVVVGDIEPHHFAGFSGGAKSASIGVCGRKTINQNHTLLQDTRSCVGRFEDNPLRQDIEEIGEIIGVNLALNAILNEKKEVLHAFFGTPQDVIRAGIQKIRETGLVKIEQPYDLVIAAAGGYPKDINLYQAQKALTHASLFCRDGGTVLLAAACEEGVGSDSYLDFMQSTTSLADAKQKFVASGFRVGPHKAFQFAMIAERINFEVMSQIDTTIMKTLCITPIKDIDTRMMQITHLLNPNAQIAIIPYATACIPIIL